MDTPETLYKQAHNLHYVERDVEGALAIYDAILEQNPHSPEATYSRTQIENLKGNPAEVAQFAKYRLKLDREAEREKLESDLDIAAEEQIRASNDVWQYQVLVDAALQSLNELGRAGWELVSSNAYKTGGGGSVNGMGGVIYTVHTQYTFKRKLPRIPSRQMQRISEQLDCVKDSLR
jgi:tetratricopeptide (TPR) repeat protein